MQQLTTSAKPVTKRQKATVKKASFKVNLNTVLKQEASANAKTDSTFKLILPVPDSPADSTAISKIKTDQEL